MSRNVLIHFLSITTTFWLFFVPEISVFTLLADIDCWISNKSFKAKPLPAYL